MEDLYGPITILEKICHVDQAAFGMDYLKKLTKNVHDVLDVKYVVIGRRSPENPMVIQTDALWAGDGFAENIDYDLKGAPCENVMSGQRICLYDGDVVNDFPEDQLLAQMGVSSYIGAPILSPEGNLVGLFVLLDDKPFKEDVPKLKSILEFLAMRAGLELSRQSAEEHLQSLNDDLQDLVKLRTRELEDALLELQKLRDD